LEDEKLRKLLESLKNRYEAGEISQENYMRLFEKYQARQTRPSTPQREETASSEICASSSSLLEAAMDAVLTRAYVCDNCGAAIQIVEGNKTSRCAFCGVINEVDYLERIADRFREEKKKVLSGVISNLVTSSMINLKLPAFMKFKSIALPYENRAIENESKAWPEIRNHLDSANWVKDNCLEASKHRHYAAELYQNAGEFASKPEQKLEVLEKLHSNEAIGYLNASLAFYRITQREPSLICKRRIARSALEAVKHFVEAHNLTHKPQYINYAVLSKILAYRGAEFWLSHHETQEMLALALYLQTSPKAQLWDNKEALHLAIGLAEQVLVEDIN
jgi:hypothetical protein